MEQGNESTGIRDQRPDIANCELRTKDYELAYSNWFMSVSRTGRPRARHMATIWPL
jgi:hypothetical protein